MSVDYALKEIEIGAGFQFDPQLAPIFVRMIREHKVTPVIETNSEGN